MRRNTNGRLTDKVSQEAGIKKMVQRSETVPPIIIGRWTPKVLFSLKERPHRYEQLRRHLGSVSQRMLTRTLRNLESTGLIARQVTRSNNIAVEYSLTQLGRTFDYLMAAICSLLPPDTLKREKQKMTMHTTRTREEWLAARLQLLKAEKELTHRSAVKALQRQFAAYATQTPVIS